MERPENVDIVAFQRMVGGRRSALQQLTGSDFVKDESGQWCVRFTRDKGGKSQLQRGRPTGYDRLALCCVSVFSLSHWRNEVTVKHYML